MYNCTFSKRRLGRKATPSVKCAVFAIGVKYTAAVIPRFGDGGMKDQSRWDLYGVREAELSATMSKDPSTKVGACILAPDGFVVSKG